MHHFKKYGIALALPLLSGLAALLFSSCNNNLYPGNMDTVIIPVPKDTSALGRIDHFIPIEALQEARKAFGNNRDSLSIKTHGLINTASEAFNKPAILEILKNPNCVGIRIYYGIMKGKEKPELKMLIVGTDSQGKDLLISRGSAVAAKLTATDGGIEYGQCCQ